MAIVHVVLFKFKAGTDANVINKMCDDMLDLKNKCIHPQSGEPYILNSSGGRNNSPEGLADGMTHAFSVIFSSEAERDFYANEDPAHIKFKEEALGTLEKAIVIDYEPNAF